MNLNEITSLIEIRNYAFISVNSGSSSKETVKYMNNIVMLIDKKLTELLNSEEFKKYVNYDNINNVIKEVRDNTNIKRGMNENK